MPNSYLCAGCTGLRYLCPIGHVRDGHHLPPAIRQIRRCMMNRVPIHASSHRPPSYQLPGSGETDFPVYTSCRALSSSDDNLGSMTVPFLLRIRLQRRTSPSPHSDPQALSPPRSYRLCPTASNTGPDASTWRAHRPPSTAHDHDRYAHWLPLTDPPPPYPAASKVRAASLLHQSATNSPTAQKRAHIFLAQRLPLFLLCRFTASSICCR